MRVHGSGGHGDFHRLPLKAPPQALFGAMEGEPMSFFLDSALSDRRHGRWSFMGSRPFMVFRARGRELATEGGGRTRRWKGDPFAALARLLAGYRVEPRSPVPPLPCGAVGFASYEAGRMLERLRGARGPGRGMPDMVFAFYESVIACDLVRNEAWIARTGLKGDGHPGLAARQRARASELAVLVERPPAAAGGRGFRLLSALRSGMSRSAYLRAVTAIKRAIAAGEVYQANLTRTFAAPYSGSPWALYLRLRKASPAPFASFLDFGGVKVASSSMERLLKVSGALAETRPIKGTRPRALEAAADRALAAELARSP
jgi:para-aminobenzoate synthetase component 1